MSRHNSVRESARRICRTLAIVLALAASLLTFPSGIVAMAACWLAAYTVAAVRRRPAAFYMMAPAAVILVKRVDGPVGLWVFMASAAAGIATSMSVFRISEQHRRFLLPSVIWLVWLGFALDSYRAVHANHAVAPLDRRPIVCIGHSLTAYT
ncbi:MAG TPA: hypothetical protein PK867_08500, partial [Pirellulales bacterium]|nr:hypothetical protein [Pirellulales bacterium]